ncbi:MAG: DUF3131 domain-containing protein [Methylococcus sp.]|nr:DUF3131 domain-containing protein [Methylococcus sp.]
MNFRKGLLAARQHIAVILGLATAAALVSWLEMPRRAAPRPEFAGQIPGPRHGALSEEEILWARAAWRYFERNSLRDSGLANSADGQPTTTMWDTGSYLLGMISAFRLGLIDKTEFDRRLGRALNALARLPLFQDQLPNRFYHAASLAMVDAEGRLSERGIGWSAVDLARLLVPLNVIVWNYPAHAGAAKAVVQRWQLDRLTRDGALTGASVGGHGLTEYSREGRGAYESYAAKAAALLGADVSAVQGTAEFSGFAAVQRIQIPVDLRPAEKNSIRNYTVGEPYIFDGVEFGWDRAGREGAYRVFRAQENRYQAMGKLTAASSGAVDEAPYFVYNTVYAEGKPWNTFGLDGSEAAESRFLSAGDAIGWYVLLDSDYSRQLADRAKTLFDPELGWYGGWYEAKDCPNRAISANTNAMVLERLHYRQFGKLVAVYAEAPPHDDIGQAAPAGVPLPESQAPAEPRAVSVIPRREGRPHAVKKGKAVAGKTKPASAKAPVKHGKKSAHSAAKPAKKRH